DALHNLAPHGFVGNFAATPLGDRTAGGSRGFTTNAHNLAYLGVANLDRPAGARHISQALDEREIAERDALEHEPAFAPPPHRWHRQRQIARDLGVVVAISRRQDNPAPQ